MAESTQTTLNEVEERLEHRMMKKIEKQIVELAGEIQKALEESLRNTMEELVKRNKQDSKRSSKNRNFNTNEQECTQGVRCFVSGDKNLNSSHFAYETALSRVDFPRFSGKKEEHYDGMMLLNLIRNSSWRKWDEYVKDLVEQYRRVNDDPIMELMNLRQQGLVIEYHEDFNAIITRLNLSEEHTLSYFLDGLRQDIQLLVRVFQPQTMMKAFTLAKIYEAANTQSCSVVLPDKVSKSYTNNKPILTMKPIVGPENYIELGKGKAKPSLTLAYMKERRAEKLHLHPIELEDEKSEKVVEEMVDFKEYKEPYILANTLTSAGTMTMIGNNMKKSLPLLIDSGNIYKCLGVQVTKKLGCLLVTVVDGNKVQMLSSVKNCKWNLHHATFLSDMMVMLLGCWDMPLKIYWLVILSDTTWNLDKLKMEHYVVGKRHILRGASYETKIELVGSSSFKKEEILSIEVSLLSKFKTEKYN
ncbi:hypothetical protein Lal_00002151 [Lupinus albus]|nr:hypothetical protein Lal_00002151 [Lupinus albus]